MTSTELYCKGARVWVADPSEVWLPGRVVKPLTDGCLEVQRVGGECEVVTVSSPADLPPLRNPDILVGANDLTSLSFLHEPAVLHNLQIRFLQLNTIYTYCGIVLVAVNPYQQLPIYGSEIVGAYSGREMGEMDPHIFAVAEEAYRTMAREHCNQSIIVSGESGAGKTVSAKYAMRYFASVGGASAETQIERKVLASNPIMEAIGNAKTTRNDNSSRFGKYIEIRFSRDHRIMGASMRTYLLEKSRVVCQSRDERNYHIFYQLCASRQLPELQEFKLGPPDDFHYTNQGDCVEISDVDDQSELSTTREALRLLGFHDDHQQHMFRVLASILHLGNIEISSGYDDREEESLIDPEDPHLLTAASLLGTEVDQLRKWLCHRRIATAQEVYTKPLTPTQAVSARDGLSKHLYAHLFQWIVNLINCSLQSGARQHAFIGVLDIYGFEVFEWNSFEQFCINYANEKLQQQFNMHVFKLEQQEYIRENIEWSFIDFYDNQPCIDLIESKLGILDLLDETCRMPKACDQLLIQKLYHTHEGRNGHFSKPRTSTSAFQLHHYAGVVEYESEGFVGKNDDSVIEEHISLLRSSKHKLVAQLFQPQGQKGQGSKATGSKVMTGRGKKGSGMITKATVGSQFHGSLSELMKTLDSTTPHYVRCIKPNDCKMPFMFDPKRAVQQLRACGVLETIRISAAGYPSRWLYSDFFERYRMLLPSGQVRRDDGRQMCEYILRRSIKDEDKYQFGRTKIFFRAGQVAYLEKLRSDKLHHSGVLIQKHIRGWLQQRKFLALRLATIRVQAHARGLLARRRAEYLRQTRAAAFIQKHVRCFIRCRQFRRLRHSAIALQAQYRGQQARRYYTALLRDAKAVVLQRHLRGWLARQVYQRSLRWIVKTQCCVRQWLARRELKRLKIQARSVDHLKKLNCGMENKIIQLQQKLSKQLALNSQLADSNHRLEGAQRCKDEALQCAEGRMRELEEELCGERKRSSTLEEQLNELKEKRDKEVADYQHQLEQLREDLQEAKDVLRDAEFPLPPSLSHSPLPSHSDSVYQQLEVELAELRDHHQDVLKDFAELEQRCARLQRELESNSDTSDVGNTTKVFSDSILSPPFSKSLISMDSSKLSHASSLPHLPTSTPGYHLGSTLYYSLLDSNVTPATLTGEKGVVFLTEVKQMVSQLEEERDLLRKDKEALEMKLSESVLQSPGEKPLFEKIQTENVTLKKEIANLKLAQGEERSQTQSVRELKQGKVSLASEVASLRQALRQSNTTSSFNISLQQEVTRLTEENLNLLESLEGFHKERVSKPRGGVPLTPLSPRRRTNPCAAVSPEKRTPVKYRAFQEKPYLGILSWQPADQSKLIAALISDLKLEQIRSHSTIPCLPAHMIFMCLRYPDHCANEEQALEFMEGVVKAIQQLTQNHHGNLDLLAFWLANTCRLMHNLRQYSGEQSSLQLVGSPHSNQSNQSCLSNFDLTEYRHLLSDRAVSIYHEIVQLITAMVQPLAVPGLLEYEAIPGISNSRPIGSKRTGSHDITVTTDRVTAELSGVLNVLEKNYVDPHTVQQIMKQVFHVIDTTLLNNLLLRRDMCHWSKGIQIRYNISQLEEWCRSHGLVESGVMDQLQPIIQAAKLLQMKKSNEEDVDTICELCSQLNPLQVQKILSMYTPANEFEERVPVSVIRLVAQRSGADQADPTHLMADMNHTLPIDFLYVPSDVSFQSLTIPRSMHLDFVVKI